MAAPTYKLTPKYYTNPGKPPRPPVGSSFLKDPMQKIRDAGTVNMSAELFEKLYLREARPSFSKPEPSPKLRAFGNPTPIALVGIVISLTPLSCDLMGLLGAGGNGAAGVGSYYFFGGLLQLIAGLLQWFMGNTFPFVVFSTYGAFFFSFAGTLTPAFNAFAAYAPPGEPAAAGLETRAFNASFGWFTLWMGVLSFIFLICSLRTNVAFMVIFAALVGVFGSLTAGYFSLAANFGRNAKTATSLFMAGGACAFVASMATWWILVSILLATLDFPVRVPVGDLSGWIRPGSAGSQRPQDLPV